MAGRPEKRTVDYFSHDAKSSKGRTLTILFNHFQHAGVSCWWLLLEELAETNDHCININSTEDFEYLSGKLHFPPRKLREILKKMADLGAIDKDLYSRGYIWSQNFVDRLKPVYEKRNQPQPLKPVINGSNNSIPVTEIPISGVDNTHTKGTKGTKVKDTILPPCSPPLGGQDNKDLRKDGKPEPKAVRVWERALVQLQGSMTAANYRTWLKDTKGLSLQGGVFTVGTPSAFAAEYLEHNQRSLIENTLAAIVKQEVRAVFRAGNGIGPGPPDDS